MKLPSRVQNSSRLRLADRPPGNAGPARRFAGAKGQTSGPLEFTAHAGLHLAGKMQGCRGGKF